MKTDFQKVQELIRFVDSWISMMHETDLTNEKLANYIKNAINMTGIDYSDTEIEEAKRDLTYRHQIHCTPGESLLADYDDENWYTDSKEEIVPKFWERYKNYLIDEKHFSPNVVATLGNETLDRDIMNYVGNPKSEKSFLKRGLVIGDVQSGKTSTYIGLMCKAADAGYKVFILLTGTIENLRKQTQERVEEGFIGIDMSADGTGGKRVGVGLDNKRIFAMSMTSRKSDFIGNSDQIAVSLQSNDAVVFVIKKNSSVLRKLIDWITTINADKITGKIDVPMLLIDDEADNASINTSKSKEDPSTINKLIRRLASLFTKSNYIGFTATPYANVFIDPITEEEMVNHDLFPEDFIYALPTPSDYIGPQQTFDQSGKYYNQLIDIDDAGRTKEDGWPFYFKHKKDWEDELPDSLTDAIYTFYLANAIRDIRGDLSSHRSMLINISRFVNVQYYIKEQVAEIHDVAYRSIKFNLNPRNMDESLNDPVIKRIYKNWMEQYQKIESIEWSDIAVTLFRSVENIQIKVVNSTNKKDKLVYTNDSSVRVIAIGGLALSRGLTLEGLVISYFYRNTATYDVLMQMGRWFGYRRGYDDIFRIWTHPDSARWYSEIAKATEILKCDMHEMHDRKMKPRSFGIRVRNDCNELQITSRNKMRNTKDEYEFSGYAGKLCETPYLPPDAPSNKRNFELIRNFTEENVSAGKTFDLMDGSGKHYVLQNIEKGKIIHLLNQMIFSRYNSNFSKEQIIDYIASETDSYIDLWDIAFMDGSVKKPSTEVTICGKSIYKAIRNYCSIEGGKLKIGQRGKLGGTSDARIGITKFNGKSPLEILSAAERDYKEYYRHTFGVEFTEGRSFPSDTWVKYVQDRKPIIIVYFIDVSLEKQESNIISKYKKEMTDTNGFETPSVGIAVGFPKNNRLSTFVTKKYKANRIYNYFEQDEAFEETEEE